MAARKGYKKGSRKVRSRMVPYLCLNVVGELRVADYRPALLPPGDRFLGHPENQQKRHHWDQPGGEHRHIGEGRGAHFKTEFH